MICKTIEIRDAATFIPALAIKLDPTNAADEYLLARAGYARDEQSEFVLLVWLSRNVANYDPHAWMGRTMPMAHQHVIDNFHALESGAVVDVEFIMGVTVKPKEAERLAYPIPAQP